MMSKTILYTLVLLLCLPAVLGATVHGTVYSVYLDVLDGARVAVNSEPQQLIIATDGDYSFDLLPGTYVLSASYELDGELFSTKEEITVLDDEGSFVLDLLLFPEFEGGEDLEEDLSDILEDVFGEEKKSISPFVVLIAIAVFVLFLLYLYWSRHHFIPEHKEEDIQSESEEDLDKLVAFVKSHEGRVTQKDIRKHFSWSESKISLMIAELEDKGTLKKIKRGRGNVIILQR